MKNTIVENNVLELLGVEDLSMRDLAEILSITQREVRKAINNLVVKGYPISNIGKYSLIKTQDQLEKCYQAQRRRALSSFKRLKALKNMRIDQSLLEE